MNTPSAIGFHQRTAIGLLVVGDADLKHGDIDAEQRTGESERGTPLAGTGLGRKLLDALLFVVPGLRHSRVGLVRTGRRNTFVLVINLGRRAERLLQPPS